jgi:hypothetical protein
MRIVGALVIAVLACQGALAQSMPTPAIPPETPPTADELDESELPTSVEQGHVGMRDSFVAPTRRERILEQRRKAFKDTRADLQLRSYLLDRDRFDGSESSAMAIGGRAGFKTGWFRDRFSIGATAYTSQRLYGPEDKDGTNLLQPGQQGYSVLGEAYLQYRLAEGVFFNAGRKLLNSPYINADDSRMVPNSFELAMLQGVLGDAALQGQWRFGLGYVGSMKEKISQIFVPMSQVAGAASEVDRGVAAAGANYQRGDFSLGAVDYYSDDIINIFYTEATYEARASAQASLRLGGDFSSRQWGAKAELVLGRALLTAAWNGTGDGADLRSPWGGIPSYNSVQLHDFNRAGEESLMLRAAYDFKAVPGLGIYGLWVDGSQPDDPAQSAREEYDLNLQWKPSQGRFTGLSVRLRYAVLKEQAGGPDTQDFRLIVNYDPPSLQ